ncbi:MAG TPA: Ldh family oxidoreductase [Bacillota bacterium]|nr:Ldh family oxidoreductase [Bacillota bacterium]
MRWVAFDQMEKFMHDVFVAAGLPEADAAVVTDVLLESDRRGIDSHGVGRLKPFYIDRIRDGIISPVTQIDVVREGPTTAVLDANNGMGHVAGKYAMQMAIDKAHELGLGMVAVRNSNHYGIAGYYTMMAAKQGMVGMTGTNARPSIAPTFGVENMLGTNPLTFAMPSDEDFPFVFDSATSIAQRGKIEVYNRLGKALPEGWVIGSDGQTRSDADGVLRDLLTGNAALAPLGGIGEELGGYKGYGYATVVEILSAALQGGSFLKALSGLQDGKKVPHHLGHFFLAIDIEAFTDLESFKRTTGEILRELRASRKVPGQDRIYTAGEKEHLAWLYRRDRGIPLPEALEKDITQLEEWYGIKL